MKNTPAFTGRAFAGRAHVHTFASLVFAGLWVFVTAFAVACDRVGFLPPPAQRLVCLNGDKAVFDGTVTDVSWSGDNVSFKDPKGATVTMHVPTTLCALTSVSPPAPPVAAPPAPVAAPPAPVASVDAGPEPKTKK